MYIYKSKSPKLKPIQIANLHSSRLDFRFCKKKRTIVNHKSHRYGNLSIAGIELIKTKSVIYRDIYHNLAKETFF